MPTNSKSYMRGYMRTYRAEHGTTSDKLTKPFVGVDGEGGNLDSGYHAYFLLRAGEHVLYPRPGEARLRTSDCLDFLCNLPDGNEYVFYFGDYDVTKILEDLPWDKLSKLMDRSLRTRKDGKGVWPLDVDDDRYQVDYLPRKEFKVRKRIRMAANGIPAQYTRWRVVSDVGSFFQCRFVEALQKWQIGTAEELEAIGTGKDARATFDYTQIADIEPYNRLEVELLAQLMDKFRDACIATGYVPAKWQGPGQLAEAMFAKHGVPLSKDVPLLQDEAFDGLVEYARNAFYGGRPELTGVGPVELPVTQWDINSAYPWAMQHVPCLMHGGWTFREYERTYEDIHSWGCYEEDTGGGPFDEAIVYGEFSPDPSDRRLPLLFGLPTRTEHGSIVYPGSGAGWYWDFEVRASIHQRMVVRSAWVYRRSCECRPLAFVSDVYDQRRSLGKDDAGIILKLALNSLYGKTVQSIGSPRYANPIWGSYITAMCRAKIQDFIHDSPQCIGTQFDVRQDDGWCGSDILMIATDSVATTTDRKDIESGNSLGGWSAEKHPRGMFLVQPGLYFGSSGKAPKTRGVPRSVIESYEPLFRDAFTEMVRSHTLNAGDIDVPQRMFVGIRYALHRRNHKLLGQWIEFEDEETGRTGKRISFDWSTKRAAFPHLEPVEGRSWLVTFPQLGSTATVTVPYSKDIGGLDARRLMREVFDVQPDWAPTIESGEMDG